MGYNAVHQDTIQQPEKDCISTNGITHCSQYYMHSGNKTCSLATKLITVQLWETTCARFSARSTCSQLIYIVMACGNTLFVSSKLGSVAGEVSQLALPLLATILLGLLPSTSSCGIDRLIDRWWHTTCSKVHRTCLMDFGTCLGNQSLLDWLLIWSLIRSVRGMHESQQCSRRCFSTCLGFACNDPSQVAA